MQEEQIIEVNTLNLHTFTLSHKYHTLTSIVDIARFLHQILPLFYDSIFYFCYLVLERVTER